MASADEIKKARKLAPQVPSRREQEQSVRDGEFQEIQKPTTSEPQAAFRTTTSSATEGGPLPAPTVSAAPAAVERPGRQTPMSPSRISISAAPAATRICSSSSSAAAQGVNAAGLSRNHRRADRTSNTTSSSNSTKLRAAPHSRCKSIAMATSKQSKSRFQRA